jgi:hypothetical protein
VLVLFVSVVTLPLTRIRSPVGNVAPAETAKKPAALSDSVITPPAGAVESFSLFGYVVNPVPVYSSPAALVPLYRRCMQQQTRFQHYIISSVELGRRL